MTLESLENGKIPSKFSRDSTPESDLNVDLKLDYNGFGLPKYNMDQIKSKTQNKRELIRQKLNHSYLAIKTDLSA